MDSLQSLDSVDADILRELAQCDPRNISLLARAVKKPIETVRYRFNRMARILNLGLTAYVVYSKLGLKRLSVFCFLPPKQMRKVGEALENLDYWTYLARFYGVGDGYYGVYALPSEQSDFLVKYIATINQNGAIKRFDVYATGNPHVVAANFSCFDFKRHSWRFEWTEWLRQLDETPEKTPPGLDDPVDFVASTDRVCLRVLEKVEGDAATSFVNVAEAIGLTPQDIRYHYFRHMMGRGIISGFRARIVPYPQPVSNVYAVFLKFSGRKSMESFADWLSTTFIAMNYSKVIGENSLILHSYLPRVEENRMHDFLFQMSEIGYLDDYYYVPIDSAHSKGWSIRAEKFDGEAWQLNQEIYLQQLRQVLESGAPDLSAQAPTQRLKPT